MICCHADSYAILYAERCSEGTPFATPLPPLAATTPLMLAAIIFHAAAAILLRAIADVATL